MATALLSTTMANADITLPALFSDGCVLQQKKPLRVYGLAAPGEKVSVALQGQTANTTADPSGKWEVILKPLSAGGPFALTVTGNNKVVVNDVLVGEVWVCSGQSNMEWTLNALPEAKDEIVHADDPHLRMFTVEKSVAKTPQTEVRGAWHEAKPQYVGNFSAVGYHFAKALRAARKVPIGMIHTSWGGTRIEAWTSRATLESIGTPASDFAPLEANNPNIKAEMEQYQKRVDAFKAAGSPTGNFVDPGIAPVAKGWEATTFDTTDWQSVNLPTHWDTSGIDALIAIDGGVWFRRTFTIPAELAGKDLTLTLGAIDDFDITFVNGMKVGATGEDTPNFYAHPRVYKIPANLIKTGENSIAVRVWDWFADGGFTGQALDMKIFAADAPTVSVPLAGAWKFKVEQSRPQNPGQPPGANDPNMATGLYNAMLVPLTKYAIAGAIWYQGESNAGNPPAYRKQMPAMISNWRKDWGEGDFPFFIVQLAPYMAIQPQPGESSWAGLREAQWDTQRMIPNVGTAVITDSGDEKDIHPHRKQPVGERLALLARSVAYGEKIAAHSPSFEKMHIADGRVTITFANAGNGLEARPVDSAGKAVDAGKVVGFAIAGEDGKFFWADAKVTGKNTVEVSSPQVAMPVAVRFGWADFPVVNLWNKDGLPVAPFRTDGPK